MNGKVEQANFAVVLFKNDHTFTVVPTNWIRENVCFWPNTKSGLKNLIVTRKKPKENWIKLDVEIMQYFGNNLYTI